MARPRGRLALCSGIMKRAELHTLAGALAALVEELRRASGGRLRWLRPLADLEAEVRELSRDGRTMDGTMLRALCDRARALFEGDGAHADFARHYWSVVDADPALGAADSAWATALAWVSDEVELRDG
jgi:hypothetical protein